MIHELSKRLDALWQYDQCIANADGKPALQDLWPDLKKQTLANIQRAKQMIAHRSLLVTSIAPTAPHRHPLPRPLAHRQRFSRRRENPRL